ncbi:alpha/beta hydrolase family protein [Sphingorhabdus contaminans]|uniref:S9 family peptidase n=1 Tax=Sphingorhabdus contaminans TaxID=1343899 RepID=A0A553WJL6_9SPHN|nr:prolyl oligopeptidase family serine peptidase [Sphingorhabdus contaminans]TSB04844.1 S9 family peptidase [Sphingorhabdus contaminans]
MKSKILSVLLAGTFLMTSTAVVAGEQDSSTNTALYAAQAATGNVDSRTIVVKAPRGKVDTAVFGKRPFMRSPVLSPDGTKIAVMMSKDGVDNLGYIDVTKPGSAPVFFAQAEEFREAGDRTIGSWRFVGNKTIVFTVLSREILGGTRSDVRRLVSYDLETKKVSPLAWDGAGGDGATILFIDDENEKLLVERDVLKDMKYSPNPEVIEVEVRTGKFKTIMRPNVEVGGWIVDGKGVVRAGVGGDGDSGKQRLMYRSDANGTMKTVANEADTTFTGTQIVPDIFLDEPDMAYATSNKDGYRKVYKVNLKTMQIVGEPIFGVKGYDVGGLIANEQRNNLAGVSYTSTRDRTRWFDPRLAEVQKLMDEDFGKGNAQIISTNDGDTKILLYIAKVNEPGGYYLFDTETGNLNLLGWYHPVLKDYEMNPMDSIRYKASDGMEIEAVVTYPRHRPHRKNLPVIVMPHGGPFGVRDQEEFGFFPWHQAMAELGYVVIQPNYRGSGGYGKEFVKEGRKPNGYGLRMQDDLNDVLTWFGQSGLIDPKRACIMGWSYGGYATARGAQRDPDKWKCAIAGAGVYDFPMMKAYDTRAFGDFGANFQATSNDLIGISSARNTDGPWSPILIVAGLRDARIPIEQSRTLVSRLKNSGKKEGVDFRYVEQPKGTHNLPYEDVHIEWLKEAEAWAERFNPAYIPSDPDKAPPVSMTVASK